MTDETVEELLEEGHDAAAAHDYERAAEQFARATRVDPHSALAWYNRALAEQHSGHMEEAVASYCHALDCDATLRPAGLNLGGLYCELHLPERSIDVLQQIVSEPVADGAEREQSELYRALGDAYFALRQFEDAILAYRQALIFDPDNSRARALLGEVREEAITLAQHIFELERHIDAEPADLSRYGEIVGMFLEGHRFQDALSAANQMIALSPLGREGYAAAAAVYEAMEDMPQAAQMWEQVLHYDPEAAEAWEHIALWRSHLGQQEAAQDAYRRALALSPEQTALYFALGDAYMDAGEYEEAVRLYGCLVEEEEVEESGLVVRLNDEEFLAAQAGLAEALNSNEAHEEAEKIARHLIDDLAEDANAYYQLATALDGQGKHEEAVEAYLQAIELDPMNAVIRNDLADTYLSLDNAETALEQIDIALALDSSLLLGYQTKAQALTKLGRTHEASVAIQKSLELQRQAM